MKKRTWLWILGGAASLICLILCGGAIFVGAAMTGNLPSQWPLSTGSPAPDFRLAALSGSEVSLSDYRDKPVILNFGASWCPDCRVEAPHLVAFARSHPEAVVLMVDGKEDRATVQTYADEFDMGYPIALDLDGMVFNTYHIWAIPTTYFIDRQGVIQGMMLDYSETKFADFLKRLDVVY